MGKDDHDARRKGAEGKMKLEGHIYEVGQHLCRWAVCHSRHLTVTSAWEIYCQVSYKYAVKSVIYPLGILGTPKGV